MPYHCALPSPIGAPCVTGRLSTVYRDRVPGASNAHLERWGALALLVRPTYVATEVVVAAATTGGYGFARDTVSRLGEVGCSAAYCSPRQELMNGSFVVFGVLLVLGATLLHRRLGLTVTALLVVSGLSSVATGLAPQDQDATLHLLAAAPLFVAQPLALLLLGARVRQEQPRAARALTTTGAVTAAAAVAFIAFGDTPVTGALERLALWPVLVALAWWAWRTTKAERVSSG